MAKTESTAVVALIELSQQKPVVVDADIDALFVPDKKAAPKVMPPVPRQRAAAGTTQPPLDVASATIERAIPVEVEAPRLPPVPSATPSRGVKAMPPPPPFPTQARPAVPLSPSSFEEEVHTQRVGRVEDSWYQTSGAVAKIEEGSVQTQPVPRQSGAPSLRWVAMVAAATGVVLAGVYLGFLDKGNPPSSPVPVVKALGAPMAAPAPVAAAAPAMAAPAPVAAAAPAMAAPAPVAAAPAPAAVAPASPAPAADAPPPSLSITAPTPAGPTAASAPAPVPQEPAVAAVEAPRLERSSRHSKRSERKASRENKRTAAAPSGNGTLMLGAKPPCAIYIDGRDTGLTTPQREISLAAGKHTVVLINKQHGIKKAFSVSINAGKTTKSVQDYSSLMK